MDSKNTIFVARGYCVYVFVDIVVHLELLLRGHCEPQVCGERSDSVFVLFARAARCWGRTHTFIF